MELGLHDVAVIEMELTITEPCHAMKKRHGDEALQSIGILLFILEISRADLASAKRNTYAKGWVGASAMITLLSSEGTLILDMLDVIACLMLQRIPHGIIWPASENHEASTCGIENRPRLTTRESA